MEQTGAALFLSTIPLVAQLFGHPVTFSTNLQDILTNADGFNLLNQRELGVLDLEFPDLIGFLLSSIYSRLPNNRSVE